MSSEIIEILNRRDLKKLELQIIVQCTPVLIRDKSSNLLSVEEKYEKSVVRICKSMFLKTFELARFNGKIIFLVYDESIIKEYFSQKENVDVLYKIGYKKGNFEYKLLEFKKRYNAYLKKRDMFPHEMGVFLGYPIEDVVGFIEYNGENSLMTGYWKVYADVSFKEKLFKKFDDCQVRILKSYASGKSLIEIVNNDFILTKSLENNKKVI